MASVTYTQQLNAAALRQLVTSPTGGLARDLMRRGLMVETQAKRNLNGGLSGPRRIDTGRLRSSIVTVPVRRDGELAVLIGTNVFYARYVHDGTGLYGPKHRPIRPVRAKLLRFKPRGKSRYVFAKEVKGMIRNQFLLDALKVAGGR